LKQAKDDLKMQMMKVINLPVKAPVPGEEKNKIEKSSVIYKYHLLPIYSRGKTRY
jgi:hypothetical protein